MKKIVILVGVLLSLLTVNPILHALGEERSIEEVIPFRIVVGFEKSIDLTIFKDIPYEVHHEFTRLQAVSISVPKEAISQLTTLDGVSWVEEDQLIKADGQVVDWGHGPVQANEAQKLQYTGKGTKVAVIDTGISGTHPDIKVSGGVSFVEGTNHSIDDNGHGTHVAGIIAAINNTIGVVGVAPGVELYSIKALDSDGIGNQTDVVAGIEWAMEHEIDIINLSITSPFDSITLKKIIENAAEQGILITAASGNDETGAGQPANTDIMFPARYKEVIGVGAVNSSLRRPAFSYIGPSLELAAPGEDIYSTYVRDGGLTNGYAYMTGTSMATPYVTGILALYNQAYPELSNAEIRELVQQNAKDLGLKGKDYEYGFGLVQSPGYMDNRFSDLKEGAWYTEPIQYLVENNVVSGYPDGTFKPAHSITREEVVTLLGRSLGLDGTLRASGFSDVDSKSFGSGFIASSQENSLITGYPDGTFKPKASITRGDVALIIYRAFDYPVSKQESFTDVDADKYYYEAINSLKDMNIADGYEDGTFKPYQSISRAEFSVLLARALNEEFKTN